MNFEQAIDAYEKRPVPSLADMPKKEIDFFGVKVTVVRAVILSAKASAKINQQAMRPDVESGGKKMLYDTSIMQALVCYHVLRNEDGNQIVFNETAAMEKITRLPAEIVNEMYQFAVGGNPLEDFRKMIVGSSVNSDADLESTISEE